MKVNIYAVTPAASDILQRLRRARFEFAATGQVDRGDGYAILKKLVDECAAAQVIECLDRHHITAWQGRRL
jgi:predicted short-subunit dehydrogenase-like oxidoreductase (DUF2520 family)